MPRKTKTVDDGPQREHDPRVFKPHEGQWPAWSAPTLSLATGLGFKVVALIAGTGGGKTFFGPRWLWREILQDPTADYLVISRTYGNLQRVALPETVKFLKALGVKGKLFKGASIEYRLPQGGRIMFGSADKPWSLEGVHVKACWLDEAGQMPYEAWRVAMRRTGFHRGPILITTTPYNLGWLKTEVYDPFVRGDKHVFVAQFRSIDNPMYPKEEYELARRTMPAWKFKMFYQGVFQRPAGLIYDVYNQDRHMVDPFDIPGHWIRKIGLDFGFRPNPTAALWIATDPDTNYDFVYREMYVYEKFFRQNAQLIRDLSVLPDGEPEDIRAIYADPARPDGIEEMNEVLSGWVKVYAADNSVMAGIETVYSKMAGDEANPGLYFFRGAVPHTVDEVETYIWEGSEDEDKITIKEAPLKKDDHCMDALRYGERGPSKKTVNGSFAFTSVARD